MSERRIARWLLISPGDDWRTPDKLFAFGAVDDEDELGPDVTRQITDFVAPPGPHPFNGIPGNTGEDVSEGIQTSARCVEANGHRQMVIDEAARIVEMSERKLLRRFKSELGITPSDYLLYVRLDIS